ncbi:MAG: hypothetical protein ACTSRU_06640 [Candidatus Hodarchaeales archaeon]
MKDEIAEKFDYETRPVNFYGNIEWKMQLFASKDLKRLQIILHNHYIDKTITEDFDSLYKLADFIRNFAVDHGITVFDRRIASQIFDSLSRAGLKITVENILEQIKKESKVEAQELEIASIEREKIAHFKFGRMISFGGLFRWKVKIGITEGIENPMLIIFQDVSTREKEEIHAGDIHGIIKVLKDKSQILNTLLLDRRLACWISDYFIQQLGIKLSFQDALFMIKEGKIKEIGIEKRTVEDLLAPEIAKELLPAQEEEVFARVTSVKIKQTPNIVETLEKIMDTHKQEEITAVSRKIIYPPSSGVVTPEKVEIIPTAPGTLPGNRYLETTLNNNTGGSMVNVEITDVLPFDLKLEQAAVNVPVSMEKSSSSRGTVVKWIIDEIKEDQIISIRYFTKQLINRTIILQKEKEVTIIKTRFSIAPCASQALHKFTARTELSGLKEREYDTLLVTDFIPREFKVKKTRISPEGLKPTYYPRENGVEVSWKKYDITASDHYAWEYDLLPEPFVTLSRGTIKSQEDSKDNLVYALLYQPFPGTSRYIITIIAENLDYDPVDTHFEVQIPANTSVLKMIVPKGESMTNFFWDIIMSLTSPEKQVLNISAHFDSYERKAASFLLESPQEPFDPYYPIQLTVNGRTSSIHVPYFQQRLLQFLPLPDEHIKLLETLKS